MKVNECVQEFLSYLGTSGRAIKTIQAYQSRLRVLQTLGDIDIHQVTKNSLEAILEAYRGDFSRVAGMTLSTYIQAIKSFFQYATNRGYLSVSPARDITRPTRARPDYDITPADMTLAAAGACTPAAAGLAMLARDITGRVEEFLHYLQAQGRRPATIQIYAERLSPLASYFVGFDVSQVRPDMVDGFITGLRGVYAAATVTGYIQACKTFFRFCQIRGYIPFSPAGHLRRCRSAAVPREKVINQSDLNMMIDYTQANGLILDYTMLVFMADTACRAGELQSLNLQDIDLEKLEARVRGKTGERILDFTQQTGAAIRVWLAIRPATDRAALFTTRLGRLSHARIYHGLERVARSLGITRFNPHAIRHRVGQAWVDQGANLELVRLKLGHRDITTTAIFYTHQDHERMKRATRQYSILEQPA